jgi:hypothetical protein
VLGWILLIVVLAALGVLGTVLELALELLLAVLLVVALVFVGGYLLVRSRTGKRR